MRSLAPEFSEAEHGLYLRLLRAAIDDDPTARNVALAGGYGTGKSSILEPLDGAYPGRVVTLSLSSVSAAEPQDPSTTTRNAAASTPTNRIQREIVKQLLYRLPPKQVPESRFRRIDKPAVLRERVTAGVVAVTAVVMCYVLGWPRSYAADSGVSWWRTAFVNLIVGGLFGGATWLAQWLMRDRVALDSVKAGPATVTLSARATSYFDEYLDEIVYFFEVSKCNIVVIEDLDRFEDTYIFETLRALNTLLNRATQLKEQWPIRFIYAVRDSIFEQSTRQPPQVESQSDRVAPVEHDDGATRANRTKFFDLVIPVVPFITHRNARDLLGDQMAASAQKVPRELVNVVARHVADMRLILNIRNEFEVFRRRLLEVEHPMPGLDEARLFALVAFKNTSPADFEAIRLQHSSLDTLYERWRSLVDANIAAQSAAKRLPGTATELGKRLKGQLEVLALHFTGTGSGSSTYSMLLAGNAVTNSDAETMEFWQTLAAGAELDVVRNGNPILRIKSDGLSTLLGRKIDPLEWGRNDAEQTRRRPLKQRDDLQFLKHHEWVALYRRAEFTVSLDEVNDGKPADFAALVTATLPSTLARELVEGGYVNQHFALYASAFHGKHLRPAAMEYVMRYVERGEPGTLYELDVADVEAILADWGTEVLSDRSMRNVSIMDHLVSSRPTDASTLVTGLLGWSAAERGFIDSYLQHGKHPANLMRLLAARLPGILIYLVNEAPADDEQRAALVDAALQGCATDVAYGSDDAVRAHLEEHFREFAALTSPMTDERAQAAVRVIALCGAQLSSVAELAPATLDAIVDAEAYAMSADNLATLAGVGDFALDVLRGEDRRVYQRAVGDLWAFLDAVGASQATAHTINDPNAFIAILNDIGDHEAAADVIVGAARSCIVATITDVSASLWADLAAEDRVACTTTNVTAYLTEHGGAVDAPLAALLQAHRTITVDDSTDAATRLSLATTIVNARPGLLDAKRRVQIAASLRPDAPLPAGSIQPLPGELIGLLLRKRLIADDANAFAPRLMVDWATREAAIANSKNFRAILAPEYLPARDVGDLLLSSRVRSEIKQAVVDNLPDYVTAATREHARRIVDALVVTGFQASADALTALVASGAAAPRVVPLLARSLDRVGDTEVVALLTAMGGEYARAVDRGNSRVAYLPDDQGHRDLVDRLVAARVVHHHEPADPKKHRGSRKVTLVRPR